MTGIAVIIVFIAYVAIPTFGGLLVRSRWRHFRMRIMKSSLHPPVSFPNGKTQGLLGEHRFLGRIEALQDRDYLWVKGEKISIRVKISDAQIAILPSQSRMPPLHETSLEEHSLEASIRFTSWQDRTPLQDGTQVYLAGFLERKEGILTMYGSHERPLLALFHEGKNVVTRAIWSGRQHHQYWNTLTPWALLAGALGLFILATAAFQTGESPWAARIILTAALVPVMPFLPPGVVFFIIYRMNWRRSRFLRAKQDLLRLSTYLSASNSEDFLKEWMKELPQDITPIIRSFQRQVLFTGILAVMAFFFGLAMNAALVTLVINAII